MTRGGGYAGEVRDLRRDTEAAFLTLESDGVSLADGFTTNLLPTQSDRSTILAAGNSLVSIPLETPQLYAITIEVNIKNPTQGHYYVYRNQVEAYRDGAGAVLHLNPSPPIVEGPSGGFGFYTVVIAALVNAITVQINNGSPNTISFARYIGYSRKPIP